MHIAALFAGKPQPFGPRGAPSSIIKKPVKQLTVQMNGTLEDEQGNKKLHGGAEKVLHQYSLTGYDVLRSQYPGYKFAPGTIGENLNVDGMTDDNVCIGDRYRVGEVLLEVSAPRAPCNKISHRFGITNLDRFVGEHGITGWYYRVVETGIIHVGDTVTREHSAPDSVSVSELMRCVFTRNAERAAQLMTLSHLDDEWREKCRRVAG